jgi:hypothetical protein
LAREVDAEVVGLDAAARPRRSLRRSAARSRASSSSMPNGFVT